MIGRCLILLLISTEAFAQTYTGPRFQAMGATGTALPGIYSLTANPAGLTDLDRMTIGAAYQHHYLTTDIATQTALIGVPTARGVFGAVVNRYGLKSVYDETVIGMAYAKAFGPSLSIAMRLNYHQLRIRRYGSSRAFSVDVGMQYQLDDALAAGIHYANPGKADYGRDMGGSIPTVLRAGMRYVSGGLVAAADAVYQAGAVDGRLGVEYALAEAFGIRGGLSFKPMQQYAGFGLQWDGLLFDSAVTFHPRLGISPQIGICYAF